MAVLSVRIDERRRKLLKTIASIEGKSISGLMEELIEEYIEKNQKKLSELLGREDLTEIMKLSEGSFMEWDNEEDEVRMTPPERRRHIDWTINHALHQSREAEEYLKDIVPTEEKTAAAALAARIACKAATEAVYRLSVVIHREEASCQS